jgi:hypothetical protein
MKTRCEVKFWNKLAENRKKWRPSRVHLRALHVMKPNTIVPPYPLIQCPRFTVVPFPSKKNLKLKKLTVHKFQNAHQAKTGPNMVKSSSPNAPSTWLIFLCRRTHAKTSESRTFIRTREIRERERKYAVNVHCSIQYTLLLLYLTLWRLMTTIVAIPHC